MKQGALVFLACALFSFCAFAVEPLWKDPYWIKLLHYNKSGSRYKSRAARRHFFLTLGGEKNPESEFNAHRKQLFDTETWYPDPNDHPACRFPLRYEWLRKKLNLEAPSYKELPCPNFQSWMERMGPSGATLTFASSYTNNPASMFGHTFVRIHRRKGSDEMPDLLHYVINFAAATGSEGGILYSIKGLFGQYPGHFGTFPYYHKIQEYNHMESRDIWEYQLSISDQELENILLHLWEHADTYYPYYFADENCSFYVLSLLEIANPEDAFTKKLPFFTIPIDTMKIVSDETSWMGPPKLRPSLKKRFLARFENLDSAEKRELRPVIRDLNLARLPTLEESARAKVLDAAMDYFAVKEGQSAKTDFQKTLLEKRSGVDIEPNDLTIVQPPDPLRSHATSRVGLGGSQIASESWVHAEIRGAYHDLLDRPDGLDASAQIQSLQGRLRISTERKQVTLDHLRVIEIVSLNPVRPYFRKPSWNVGFGWRTSFSEACFDCSSLYLEGGPGFTLGAPSSKRLYATVFANALLDIGPWNESDYRVGPSAVAMVNWDITSWLRWMIGGNLNYSPLGAPTTNYIIDGTLALDITDSWSLRGWVRKFSEEQDFGATVFYYF